MKIELISDTLSAEWDQYVDKNEHGTFFHLHGWQEVFARALGHPTYYLAAISNGEIVGVLPLVHVKSLLFGNTLSSIAFGSYGGAIANDTEIARALEQRAVEIGTSLGVGSVEFRYLHATDQDRPRKDLYERFVKPILVDEDENMKAIRSKQRNMIRKGIKKGLALKEDNCEAFYGIYAESVRNLGTPVFPKKLFQTMMAIFPQHLEIVTAHLNNEPVSSAMLYYFKHEVCPFYWGGRYIARALAGNDFLAWQIICRAAERGITQFDFGRSKKDTGSRQWKVNLGFEAEQLHYEYELIRDKQMPDVNPSNPKYRYFIDTWKKLPLPVARTIGPIISKNLG
ncbi:MAG: FemAB family XrtA/PEP-CTERM system-associated protein [Pseudomonadota bacterium]